MLGTGGPIVFQPTDHDINVTPDGTITVQEGSSQTDSLRGKLRLVSFPDAQKLLKEGSNLYSAGEGCAAARHSNPRCARVSSRNPTSTRWRR